jgi:uncharacterized protein
MAEKAADFEVLAPAGFEWDDEKSRTNLIKHGVDFDDASGIFYEPVVLRQSDRHDEERWMAIGSLENRLDTSGRGDTDYLSAACEEK